MTGSVPSARRLLAVAASAALVVPLLASPGRAAPPDRDGAEVTAALTPAQRASLQAASTLEAPDEVQVSADIDTSSDDPVDVIVTLRQPAPAAARALAAARGRDLPQQAAQRAVDATQDRFTDFLDRAGIGGGADRSVTRTWGLAVNAIGLRLPGTQVSRLLESADVASVAPDAVVSLDLPRRPTDVVGVTGDTDGGIATVGRTHAEVAQLHDQGTTGAGIDVGVLDSGIDYDHPSLDGVYAGGWDFVDRDDDPMETTWDDYLACNCALTRNGSTYHTSHGTHVAGIIAGRDADGSQGAFGVAPDVRIHAYRVLGPYGSGSTSDILSGMERAMVDGMDVVNMSLGMDLNDHLNPLSQAANTMTLAGVTTVLAAGNAGAGGAQTVGSPSTAALAITVGANDSPMRLPTIAAKVGDAATEARLIGHPPNELGDALQGQDFELVDVGDGTWRGYSGKDVRGNVVLIERGGATFETMALTAWQRGAVAAVVSNNNLDEGAIPHYIGDDERWVPIFGMTAQEGSAVRAAMAAGDTQVTFGDMGQVTTEGNTLAGFSSRGPAKGTTDVKPEVTAPGVSILSTVPTWEVDPQTPGDYTKAWARKSGTSMAAPFAAGLAALVLQAHPGMAPADVKTRLMNTADALRRDESVFDAGAGQVDPLQAVHATADLQVDDVMLGSDDRGASTAIADITGAMAFGLLSPDEASSDSRHVVMHNRSADRVTLEVAVDIEHGGGSADLAANGVQVVVPDRVILPPGGQRPVELAFEVPAGADLGTYGGYVVVSQDGQEPLRIPFGFRVARPGITGFPMVKPFMSTNPGETVSPTLQFGVGVETATRVLDVYLVEPDTGADVGWLGSIDGMQLADGVLYGPFGWDGAYFPLTDDADFPISHRQALVGPGHHQLRVVGTNDVGATYDAVADFYVDNTPPELTTSIDDVEWFEFTGGQRTWELTGTLVDGQVDDMVAAGFDVDQSDNQLLHYQFGSRPSDVTRPEPDGSFADDINLTFGPVQGARFAGVDAAGNLGGQRQATLFRDTQAHLQVDTDTNVMRPGDRGTATVTTHNAEDFGTMTLQFYYDTRMTQLGAITPSDGFAPYGRIDGEPTFTNVTDTFLRAEIDVVFDGSEEYTGDGLPLVTVAFAAKGEDPVASQTGFASVSSFVRRSDGGGVSMQRRIDHVQLLRDTSTLIGGYIAQGMLTAEGAIDPDRDYRDVDVAISLQAPDGTVVELPPAADGDFGTSTLALHADPWQLTATMPGHLTWHGEVDLADEADDGLAGRVTFVSALTAAGDVNGDDVVDVLDAIAVRDARGSDDRAADINADGAVDVTDLGFVELNYLLRNPTVDEVPVPRDRYRGTTLDDVLAAFAA